MTDIKELALRVAKESPWYYDNEPVGDSDAIDFAQRFLAAYLAEQEPVAWFDDHYHDFSHVERLGWKPLFTAPPEPAPQQKYDAERYRWIASNHDCPFAETDEAWESKEKLDAAIDAARST